MSFCCGCGTQLRAGAKFCHRCGQKAMIPSAEQSPAAEEAAWTVVADPQPAYMPEEPCAPAYMPEPEPYVSFQGPACYYHPEAPAVVQCARCGKPICRDCSEAYGVSAGEFAGMCLCYDCCMSLVEDNVRILKKQKRQILTTFLMTIFGMLVGAAVVASSESPVAMIVAALWFGSFWVWFKTSILAYFSGANKQTKGSFFIGAVIGGAITAPIKTVIKLVQCIVHLSKTSGAMKSDQSSLAQMQAYMEYTQIIGQNPNVDPEVLIRQDSRLQNNVYAQMLLAQGEAAADAQLRQCTDSIAANRETLQDFSF